MKFKRKHGGRGSFCYEDLCQMHRQGEEKFLLRSNNRNPRVIPHKYLLSSFITSQQGVIKTALDFQVSNQD